MKRKIGWQTYQDLIEKQINSPMLNMLIDSLSNKVADSMGLDNEEEIAYNDQQTEAMDLGPMLPISNQLIEDMAMLSNYDCWIGHCNFDITEDIKELLDQTPGIEVLKIISRYRFFVGIGKMFEFTDVRKYIDEEIIQAE